MPCWNRYVSAEKLVSLPLKTLEWKGSPVIADCVCTVPQDNQGAVLAMLGPPFLWEEVLVLPNGALSP